VLLPGIHTHVLDGQRCEVELEERGQTRIGDGQRGLSVTRQLNFAGHYQPLSTGVG